LSCNALLIIIELTQIVERFSHLMKFWPVPNSYTKILPNAGTPGSFWEDRGDRNHCGIDIYAPRRSPVLAVDTGRVVEAGIFTSPAAVPYWNVTYYVLVQQEDGLVAKYAELDEAFVKEGDRAGAGEVIGLVGSVLNPNEITGDSPPYVQLLKGNGHSSMLHFELYQGLPMMPFKYLGGNAFNPEKPPNILDPTLYLERAGD
jgi:murein DD-endopeptidase MepM/ murein hydrolase activator NlpD